MCIPAFEGIRHLLESHSEGDRIEVAEIEAQRSAIRQKFWVLEQYVERDLRDRDGLGIWGDGESSRSRCRANQIKVVGHGNPMPTGDLEDIVLDIAVEREVCEGRGSGNWRRISTRGPCGGGRALLSRGRWST